MWSLISNDGWQRLEWQPKEIVVKDVVHALGELRLIGSNWDPTALLTADEFVLGEHSTLAMPNVLLLLSSIDAMIEGLNRWLVDRSAIDLSLADEPSLTIGLQLGPNRRLISTIEQPVCTISCYSARLRWEWLMVVDETCLRSFLNDILRWRATLEET